MIRWPYKLVECPPEAVKDAVADDYWQRYREGLKGLSTEQKLDKLRSYLDDGILWSRDTTGYLQYELRVSNYINALKRGGQLDSDLKVVR